MRLPGFRKRRRSAASDAEEEVAASNSEPPEAFQNNADNDDSGAANGSFGYGLRPEAMMTHSASSHNAYPPQGNLPSARTSTSIDGITYRLWSPFFLRKIFLFALIVLFMAISITLGVLFSQSSRHKGLSTAKESYYYLWTYGPTAVFTSIAALWAQVEYRSKQLMPWNALQRAPQRCETSLLLDYVDPMNIVSLFTSLRRSHIFVTVAIAGALIVQLMVVMSSGLFQAISVTVTTDDATLMAMEAFTGDYNDSITSRPASVIFGNLLYNLSYPLGTTRDYAYPLFDSSHSSVESLAAVVDVFSADLDCATAKVDQITQGFFGGLTDNPLIDDDGFTVTTDGDARNVWLAAADERNCTGLVAKIRNGHTWAYNGSFCQEQPNGADRNRLVFVSGSWNSDSTRTFTVDDLTTSTAGLIPGSLLAGRPSITTSALLSTAVFSTVSTSPSKSGSGSTSGNDIQLDDPTVGSNDVFIQTASRTGPTYSNVLFIQTAARTASASLTSATGSSGNDIQLDDPPSDLTIGIIDKRAYESPSSTAGGSSGTPTFYVLPTTSYIPSVAFICKPRYSIRKANVTLSKTASDADINTNTASSSSGLAFANMTLLEGDDAEERQLDDFTAWRIMSPVFMAMELSDAELMNGGLLSFINSMAPEAPAGGNEQDRLIQGLRQTFRSISAQVASTYLTENLTTQNSTDGARNRTLSGSTVAHETRLAMQAPAFWVTEVALLVAVFGTSYLMLSSPDMRLSRDPGTIGGLATVLARSRRVMQLLSGTGSLPLKRIQEEILGPDREFGAGILRPSRASAAQGEFVIEVENENESQARASQELQRRETFNEPPDWYRPFAVSFLGNLLIASVPLALIVALEILFQYSERHDGLTDVDDDNLYAHYAWTFIPTLTMVGVGQLFGMLDFATKVFAPYSALRHSSGAPASTSIMASYLDKLGVHALFAALARRQWAVAAATVATVLSPFLTIVTSGLLNAEAAPANYTVLIKQLDAFTGNQSQYGDGIVAANLMLANNLTYPQWTYDTIAIPRFELAAEQASASLAILARNATTLRATVPAVRGVANCTVATAPFAAFQNCSAQWLKLYFATVGDAFNPHSTANFAGDGYFGWWEEPWYEDSSSNSTRPPGCPPIISTFGRVVAGKVAQATHLACSPYVETVRANVSLALPAYRIIVDDDNNRPAAPPVIGGGDFFSDEFWAFSAAGKGGYKLTNPNPRNDTSEDLAALYGLVVWGTDGVPKAELVGDRQAEERLVRRVERVYAQVLAQILHKEREWVGNTSASASAVKRDDGGLTGTILYNGRTRLKQSPVSTRILEGLLAAMFACAALTFALLDTRKVLPKNPCSIAAVASLLAGSSLLANIPEGAEWISDKQLREKGVFEGIVFSLGWWGDEEYGVSDGDGASDGNGADRRFGIDIGTAMSEKGDASETGSGSEEKKRWRPTWWRKIWPEVGKDRICEKRR